MIANCREIVEATDLPVNCDLENCFAHQPAAAAEAIQLAAEAGAVSSSIEDYTKDKATPIHEFDLTVDAGATDVVPLILLFRTR